MDRSKAIELLKQALHEIPRLRKLAYDNQDFKLWRDKVRNIIKAGLDTDDYQTFRSCRPVHMRGVFTEEFYQKDYLDELTDYETALKSIIQKYEILGIESEPSPTIVPPKDVGEVPSYLFDNMQLHPKIIEASEALFKDGHYAQAIFEAFKAVENFVREKSGLSSYGKNLMATAFNEENPIIKVPEAGDFDKDVQEGFKFLFMGATQGIRNPKAHKEIVQNDPFITLEYLGLASFLLKRIDYWGADIS